MPGSDPIPRPSVRVLLVDEAGRILLFSSRNESDGSTHWYTAGGGVKSGESHEQAARREVWEETGLTEVTLSTEVWRGQPWIAFRDGVTHEVRSPARPITVDG